MSFTFQRFLLARADESKSETYPFPGVTLPNKPFHRIAARGRFGVNLKSLGWAARDERRVRRCIQPRVQ